MSEWAELISEQILKKGIIVTSHIEKANCLIVAVDFSAKRKIDTQIKSLFILNILVTELSKKDI
jgi:hypothetical protein